MNKKGFTMIELLATITILGILSIVAIGSVSYLIKNSKQNYYQSQRNNLISAAKSYYQANRSKLPKDIGTDKEVSYGDLKNSKYIGKLVASDRKTECDSDGTKVVVTKVDKNKYKYKSYLDCGIDKDTHDQNTEQIAFNVTPVKKSIDPLTYYFTISTSSDVKIKSYSYTILKNNYNYVGPISEKANGTSVSTKSFDIDLNDTKQENTFTYSVTVVYKHKDTNKTFIKKDNLPINDTTAPKCTNITSDRNTWGRDPQTIKFDCVDNIGSGEGYASGCQKGSYKLILKTSGDVNKYKEGVTIYDKAGNPGVCDIKNFIRLDLDPPTCPTAVTGYLKSSAADITTPPSSATIATNTWSNKWILTIPSGATDALSGGIYYKVTTTGATENVTDLKQDYRNVNAEGVSTVSYQACDQVNNCTTSCNSKFIAKLDRTPPTCGSKSGESTTWSNGASRTVSIGCVDSGSGCTQSSYSQTVTDEVKTKRLTLTIKDNLGYTTPCTNDYNIYLDRTKPSVGLSTSNDNYSFTGTGSDSLSGMGGYHWYGEGWASASGASISKTKNAATSNGVYGFYVKDAAGNENYKTINNAYISCTQTYKRDADSDRCGHKVSLDVYKWTYDTRDCSGSDRYYRKYDFKQYSCVCKYDSKSKHYCSQDHYDITECYHGPNHAYIYYKHDSNGQDACKANKKINSYVTEVCNSDDYDSTDGTNFFYHGYKFFGGGDVGNWSGMSSGWTFNYQDKAQNRPPSDATVGGACAYACKQKYGN